MSEADELSAEQVAERLSDFVIEQIRLGHSRAEIEENLRGRLPVAFEFVVAATIAGVPPELIVEAVNSVYEDLSKIAAHERLNVFAILPGLAGGVVAALIGGGVWAFVGIATDRQIGWIAILVGWLAGFGVNRFASGQRGPVMQTIAAFASVLGILTGKYVMVYYNLREAIVEEYREGAGEVPVISAEILGLFYEYLESSVDGYDLLFVGLAVYTAWRMLRPLGVSEDSGEVIIAKDSVFTPEEEEMEEPVATCPACGAGFNPEDYRADINEKLCSACKAPLPSEHWDAR